MNSHPCRRSRRGTGHASTPFDSTRSTVRRRRYERAILLVDDDPDQAIPLIAALAAAPRTRFTLRVSETAAEGVERLCHGRTHAVLLDLALRRRPWGPELDLLRTVRPDVPVVVVTDLRRLHDGRAALHRGARGFLLRSEVTPRRLEAVLSAAIEPTSGPRRPRPAPNGSRSCPPPRHADTNRRGSTHEHHDPGGTR